MGNFISSSGKLVTPKNTSARRWDFTECFVCGNKEARYHALICTTLMARISAVLEFCAFQSQDQSDSLSAAARRQASAGIISHLMMLVTGLGLVTRLPCHHKSNSKVKTIAATVLQPATNSKWRQSRHSRYRTDLKIYGKHETTPSP